MKYRETEIEGQLSIFDIFDFLKEDDTEKAINKQRQIENEVIERIYNWTIRYCKDWKKLPQKDRITKLKEANNHSGGARDNYLWDCNLRGIDITFDEPIGKCTGVHIGWPMVDKNLRQKVCKFSGHTCNREELWKVADSLDEIECIKVCCRQCKIKLCGARCNGCGKE